MNALFRRFIFCAPIASFVFLLLAASLTAIPAGSRLSGEPAELALLRRAYPHIEFTCVYDDVQKDFKIELARKKAKTSQTAAPASARHIASTPQTAVCDWADGRMLPLEKLGKKESYWKLMYTYTKDIPDPAHFSEQDIQRLRKFSSAENRLRQAGVSLDFFNAVYDSATRQSTESHIKRVSFLGKYTNAHEWIFAPLARVENKIRELAKIDSEVRGFVDTLARVDSYTWREIGDRASRSFHSYGIAVDVLPRGWGQKNIYWAWRRDIDPDGWMTLPLDKRWMPPLKVIEAFESEGFIWGGKWPIWDNMHFEYRPELIEKAAQN